jgi:hypothetical protein
LSRRKIVIEDDDVRPILLGEQPQLFDLSFAEIGGHVWALTPLGKGTHDTRSGRFG